MSRLEVPVLAEEHPARTKTRVEVGQTLSGRGDEVDVQEHDVKGTVEVGEGLSEEPFVQRANLRRAVANQAPADRAETPSKGPSQEPELPAVEEAMPLVVVWHAPEGVEGIEGSSDFTDHQAELHRARARSDPRFDHSRRRTGQDCVGHFQNLGQRVVTPKGTGHSEEATEETKPNALFAPRRNRRTASRSRVSRNFKV